VVLRLVGSVTRGHSSLVTRVLGDDTEVLSIAQENGLGYLQRKDGCAAHGFLRLVVFHQLVAISGPQVFARSRSAAGQSAGNTFVDGWYNCVVSEARGQPDPFSYPPTSHFKHHGLRSFKTSATSTLSSVCARELWATRCRASTTFDENRDDC
jgi:hypothetical protein